MLEAWVAGEIDAQGQGVGEDPNEAFNLGVAAAGDRHTDDEVFESAITAQEDFKACKQRHIKCGAVGEADGVEFRGQFR